MKIDVYTDGSATVKTKPGGFGWVMVIDGQKHSEGNGHIPLASNNDAELEAAIHGLAAVLRFLTPPPEGTPPLGQYKVGDVNAEVTLVSDSQITLNWANGTYRFKQEAKMARFNILKQLMTRLKAQTRWVQGHSGDEHNERCDVLANEGRVGPKPPKPPKKPRVENRLFRWNEQSQKYEHKKTLKEILEDFLMFDSEYTQDVRPSTQLTLETLTSVVIELMELEEARKK